MLKLFDIQPYFELLATGSTIVTANARQSAKMRSAYSYAQVETNPVCHAPNLHSFNSWTAKLWQQLQLIDDAHSNKILLNPQQRQALWTEIIEPDLDALPLVNAAQLIPHADSALKSLQLWQIDPVTLDTADSLQALYRGWYIRFTERLQSNSWVTNEQIQQCLTEAFTSARLKPLKRLIAYGFDDIPPQTQALLHAATENLEMGEHYEKSSPTNNSTITRKRFSSRTDEIIAAANWAKGLLAKEENCSIGIIAPNLGQVRDAIESQFIETFEPHYLNVEENRYVLPFNFSAGTPLANAPVIQDALSLMRLVTGKVNQDQAFALLYSPFWGKDSRDGAFGNTRLDDTRLDNSRLDQDRLIAAMNLSQSPKRELTASDFRRLFEAPESPTLTSLLRIDRLLKQSPKLLAIGEWLDCLRELLSELGWPGQRRLDSAEYQQVSQFQALLESTTSLALTTPQITLTNLLATIQKQAQSTPFQAKTPDSPIQILGALEGAALKFDYCWVLGLDDQTWPPPPSPNPLLPVDLQRRHKMPNASAAKQLDYARSLTQKLKQSADRVVFSYAVQVGDSELSPSGLILDIESEGDSNDDSIKTTWNGHLVTLFDQRQYRWVEWSKAPDLADQGTQAGGVSVLQWQAAQPVNAFARFRLGLDPLPVVEDHLSPALRGQITHAALATIWTELKDQNRLINLPSEQLSVLITEAVAQALANYQTRTPLLTPERAKLEAERQCAMIELWLELEKQRPPFEVIAIEQASLAEIAGLSFKVRLDRVDRCENEEFLLIDYKAGSQQSIQSWFPERTQAPQLPIYAITAEQKIAAISYAIVNGEKQSFVGLGELNNAFDGISQQFRQSSLSWPETFDAWVADLTATCEEFKQGLIANVDYHSSVTRNQQDYLAFNRLPEHKANLQLWSTHKEPACDQ